MAKFGLLHDYDLQANNEDSARDNTCVVCDVSPVTYQWSDYSGEAMCTRCGCNYQLKWGSDEQEKEGKYPYLNVKDEFIPVLREYWQLHHTFVHYGTSLSNHQGIPEFNAWVKANHPELVG